MAISWWKEAVRLCPMRVAVPRWFLALAVFALAARVLLWWQNLSSPFAAFAIGDERNYWEWAGRIAAGRWAPEGVFYQGPLFPYLLAVLKAAFPSFGPPALSAAQLFLNWFSCLLLLPLLRPRVGKEVALTASSLALFFGPAAFFALKGVAATLGLFLLTAGLAVLPSRPGGWAGRCLLAGALLGLAVLAVPFVLPVAVAAVAYLLLRPPVAGRLPPVLLFLLSFTLAMLPVSASNFLQDGSLVPVSSGFGFVFHVGNNPEADGGYTQVEGISTQVKEQEKEAAALAERQAGRHLTAQEVSGHYFRKGARFIATHPFHWLLLLGRKILLLGSGLDVPLEFSLPPERRDFLPLLWLLPLGGTAVLLLASLVPLRPCTGKGLLLPILAAGALGSVCLVFYAANRYALPFFFLAIPLAATGLHALPLLWSRPRGALLLLPVAICLLLSAPDLQDSSWEAEGYLPKLLAAYGAKGDQAGVNATLARIRAIEKDSPAYFLLAAEVYREHGERENALAAYTSAISREREGRDALVGRAGLLWEMGQRDLALADLSRVLRMDPKDREAQALFHRWTAEAGPSLGR